MRTFLQVTLAIAALIIVPTIGLLVYLSVADLTVHKEYFEDEISEALGHDVSIDGLFDLQVGGRIVFTVEDVSASNPEWTDNNVYFTAERMHLVIDSWSMMGDAMEIDALELTGVQLNLHQNVDGQGNWEPNLTEVQTVAVQYDNDGDLPIVLHRMALQNIALSYEKEGDSAQAIEIAAFQLDRDTDGAMTAGLSGSYMDDAMTIPFTATGLVQLKTQSIMVRNTSIGIGGGTFAIIGSMDSDGSGAVNVVAEGADLSVLGDTFGTSGLPGLPYTLSAHLAADADSILLEDIQFALGEGQITGSLSVNTGQEMPRIVANLTSPLLDLRMPEPTESEAESTEDEVDNDEDVRIFGDEPLAYSWLDSANVEADLTVNRIFLADDQLENLTLKVVLEDGALTINPLSFDSGEGGMTGSVDLRPGQGRHTLGLMTVMNNLRPGALAIEGLQRDAIPALDLEVQLSGEGTTMHEIMSSSNGNISGRQGAGQINMQAAGVLFSDLFTSILRTLNPLAETESVTTLECGVYEIDIVDGVATIEQMALQTERLTIVSSGNIDLSTEEIDLTLRTKTREGLGVSLGGVVNSFLKVGGTLSNPSLGVDAAGSVTTTGAAVATGGLSVLARGLWDRVSAEADICDQPDDAAAPQ